jgi:hypothetical protein
MKAFIIILTLTTGLSLQVHAATNKTGELKSATASSLSVQQEMDLLREYFPELNTEESKNEILQVYDSNFELIIEGVKNDSEEIKNEELAKYLQNSSFLMSIDNRSLYMLEN